MTATQPETPCFLKGGALIEGSLPVIEERLRPAFRYTRAHFLDRRSFTGVEKAVAHLAEEIDRSHRRYLFADLGSWTAAYSSWPPGNDCYTLALGLSEVGKGGALCVSLVEESEVRYAEFSGGQKLRVLTRRVNDHDRWEFYEAGPRLPWEDSARYSRRRIKERLTADMVRAYVRHRTGVDFPEDVEGLRRATALRGITIDMTGC